MTQQMTICLQPPQRLHNSLGLPMMGGGGGVFGGGLGPEAQLPDDIMGGIDDGNMRQRNGPRGGRGGQMQPPQMQQQYGGPVGPQGGRGGRGPGRGPQPNRWAPAPLGSMLLLGMH